MRLCEMIITDDEYIIDGVIKKDINEQEIMIGMLIQIPGYKGGIFEVTDEEASDIDITIGSFTLKRIIENNEINVEVFGAIGDGVTDDTMAIQKAIDYSSLKKVNIKFNQSYLTTSPLYLKETCCLYGGVYNNEYKKRALIVNNTSDMFVIDKGKVVGAQLENLCFVGSQTCIKSKSNNDTLNWSTIKDCGFVNFDKTFDLYMLGCRFSKLWVNYGNSMGILRGSDNVIENSFVNNKNPARSGVLLKLDNFSLSRLDNVYFTGKNYSDAGINTILEVLNYSSNLDINGCYFDLSYGSGLVINGAANDFPKSGCTGINVIGCLFRGNCQNNTATYNAIVVDYARNINFIGNSFKEIGNLGQQVNPNSKLYEFKQFAQGCLLQNNYYEVPYSITGSQKDNVSILELYPYNQNNWGIRSLSLNRINIQKETQTTGPTYGDVTVTFKQYYGNIPSVFVSVRKSTIYATINSVSSKNVQIIFRRTSNGDPVVSTAVDFDVLIVENL